MILSEKQVLVISQPDKHTFKNISVPNCKQIF
jgi:hypothetical protein